MVEEPDGPDLLIKYLDRLIPIIQYNENIVVELRPEGVCLYQVAALLGVSRRSVHAWVAGNPVRTRNLDRLTAVENRLGLPDMNTAVNHHRLFSGNPAAPSLFARLLADTQVSSPSKAADLLGGTVDAPMIRGRQLTGAEWQLPGE